MICLNKKDSVCCDKTAVALGLFDGVHKGHQMIINKAVELARENEGIRSAVFCFQTDSVSSKGHDGKIEMLMTDSQKAQKFEEIGVDYLFSPHFDDMKSMPPEVFVRDVLKGRLNCSYAVCGVDFSFGRAALGKAEDLIRLGEKYGIKVFVLDQLSCDVGVISSTLIRRCIRHGEIAKANDMLGYRFGFTIQVEQGNKIGRTIDFPTINQKIPKGSVMPKFGVYCSKVLIDGVWYRGVTNIGVKPTVHIKTYPLAETYIMGYHGDLYGRVLTLELYEFVRAEKVFDNLDQLKQEISSNKQFANEYFEKLENR